MPRNAEVPQPAVTPPGPSGAPAATAARRPSVWDLPPVAANLSTTADGTPRLIGSACRACGTLAFPQQQSVAAAAEPLAAGVVPFVLEAHGDAVLAEYPQAFRSMQSNSDSHLAVRNSTISARPVAKTILQFPQFSKSPSVG